MSEPKINCDYIWMSGGTPQRVTIVDIKENPYDGKHHEDGSYTPAGKDITVEIEFVWRNGRIVRLHTRWTDAGFKQVLPEED